MDSAGRMGQGLRGGWVVGGDLGVCGRSTTVGRHGFVCGRLYLPPSWTALVSGDKEEDGRTVVAR